MKVFIVEKYGGQYEDSWEYVDKVFDDIKKAEEYVERDKKIIKSFWKNKLEFSELCDNIIKENTDDKGYWKEGVDHSDFKWLYSFEDDNKREKQFIDIDSFKEYEDNYFLENLESEINKVHICEKNMFFSLLTDDFLDTLNPIY